MTDQHSVLDPNYRFRYESDWHAYSLLSFAQQTHNALNQEVRSERAIGTLVDHFIKVADRYYTKGLELLEEPLSESDKDKNTPFHRHQLIERIGEEWAQIMPLASTSQLLSKVDEQVLTILTHVIEDALDNLKMERKEVAIMPHFGRHFELVKFRYAPEVAMLGIPLTSLYCPWEWSIIWHEVAGLYIASEEAKLPINALLDEMKALPEEIWVDWSNKYYQEMKDLPLVDDESDDHHRSASHTDQPPEWVLRNWSEEFIEDAVGVLCLGNSMAHGLTQILSQHYNLEKFLAEGIRNIIDSNSEPEEEEGQGEGKGEGQAKDVGRDTRHPPAELRILVAHRLSHLMGLEEDRVEDEGVHRLAQVIFDHSDKMVNRTFTSQNRKSPTKGSHHWIASAVGAFQAVTEALEEGVDEVLDEVVQPIKNMVNSLFASPDEEKRHDHLQVQSFESEEQPIKNLLRTLSASPRPPYEEIGRDHQLRQSFQSDLEQVITELQQITTFDELLKYLFSEIDRGSASLYRSHDHQSGKALLHIRFSAVRSHYRLHSGTFTLPHRNHHHD
ncbi:MAG: hypothetical protein ACPGWR_08145 [Ardenticatenaceae bacterium]